jgi:hypothetical protein
LKRNDNVSEGIIEIFLVVANSTQRSSFLPWPPLGDFGDVLVFLPKKIMRFRVRV